MSASPGPVAPASRDPRARAAVQEYLLKEKDDEVVLAFGPDYFHGARTGAGLGGLGTALWSYWIYRRMKADQRQADFEVGLRRGARNPNFSQWVLARGLRSQPMLTVGCYALMATTVFKVTKCYLAHRRCLEFMLDDAEFAMLAQMSKGDPITRELFEKLCSEAREAGAGPTTASTSKGLNGAAVRERKTSTTAAAAYKGSMGQFHSGDDPSFGVTLSGSPGMASSRRPPTYWDGVAVGLMGSIMDCYVPMKPVWKYYNMHFGMV